MALTFSCNYMLTRWDINHTRGAQPVTQLWVCDESEISKKQQKTNIYIYIYIYYMYLGGRVSIHA